MMNPMAKRRRAIALVAVIATAILGGYFLLRQPKATEEGEIVRVTSRSMAVPVAQPDELEPRTAATAPAVADPIKPATITLAGQLREAKDLRKFSVEVQAQAASGGISYAMYATELCRNVHMALENASIPWEIADLPYTAPEDPRAHAVRNASLHKVKAACQGFNRGDFEDGHLPAKAQAQKDPLYQLRAQAQLINSDSSLGDRKSALAAVLENGDPLLISQTLQRLLLSDKTGGGVNIWVDGAQMPIAQAEMYFNALQVLHCRLGLVCNELSHEVLDMCIATGECFSDRVELFRSRMPPEYREEFDATLARLESAVRDRRVNRFLP